MFIFYSILNNYVCWWRWYEWLVMIRCIINICIPLFHYYNWIWEIVANSNREIGITTFCCMDLILVFLPRYLMSLFVSWLKCFSARFSIQRSSEWLKMLWFRADIINSFWPEFGSSQLIITVSYSDQDLLIRWWFVRSTFPIILLRFSSKSICNILTSIYIKSIGGKKR